MRESVEQIVDEYRKASELHRRMIGNDPVKARAFLIRAGILKPHSNPVANDQPVAPRADH